MRLKEVAHVVLQAHEGFRMTVAGVAAKHWYDVLNAVVITCQLVVPLGVMHGILVNLLLTFTDENVAYLT